jgi:acid phosphatase family membrane protein YuiD
MLGPADGVDDDMDIPGGGLPERPRAATLSLATVLSTGLTGGMAALACASTPIFICTGGGVKAEAGKGADLLKGSCMAFAVGCNGAVGFMSMRAP